MTRIEVSGYKTRQIREKNNIIIIIMNIRTVSILEISSFTIDKDKLE